VPLSKQYGLSRGWPLAPGLGPINLNKGGGASAYAPFAAPTGYRWDYVTTFLGERVTTFPGQPVVTLVRAA